jgi:hypothetical protein
MGLSQPLPLVASKMAFLTSHRGVDRKAQDLPGESQYITKVLKKNTKTNIQLAKGETSVGRSYF